MAGRSVRIFLADGTPRGIRTAELGNWTGKALVCPRSELPRFGKRKEVSKTGIYLLFGQSIKNPAVLESYVGEGDEVWKRIAAHDKDSGKDFWTTVVVFISKDENLTKAHARWLESKLVAELSAAKRVSLKNSTNPQGGGLPESDEADMETFFENIKLLLPILGFDVLVKQTVAATPNVKSQEDGDSGGTSAEGPEAPAAVAGDGLVLVMKYKKARAQCVVTDGSYVVQAGSTAVAAIMDSLKTASPGYVQIKKWLIESGVLVECQDNPKLLKFASDYAFDSPSAAAGIVAGVAQNGRWVWKIKGNETLSYKEWQKKQLASK